MALIRLTADNAEEVTRQVVGDLAELVGAAGKSPALAKLGERTANLENLVGSGVLEVEVILGEVSEQWRGAVARWLQIDEGILQDAISSQEPIELPLQFDRRFSVVRIRSGYDSAGRQAGQRVPPILVVVHTPEPAPEKEIKDAIFDAVQEHPLSLLLVPAAAGWAKALATLASRDRWMCKAIGLELLAERDLEENLQLSPWKETAPFMVGWSATGAMGSLYNGLGLALEKEQRSLKSKRTLLDQKAAVDQQKATGNAGEIIGEVRGYIQKQFDNFQKESANRMQSAIGQFDGSLSQEIEASIKAFNQFEYEKKPKTLIVRVPAETQNHLLSRAKEVLSEAGRADLVAMGETFRRAQEEVEKLVEAKSGPPTVVHFNYLPDHELTNLVERSIGIQRPYSGTLPRRGPMDYFMAARRYQMVFFMMFSAFGLSFVRSYRQVMVPMTVLLLSFGLLNVVNSTRKQEKETEELELEKARELLRAELRRSMNEVDKSWSSAMSSHLSSQQSIALERIEATVNTYFEGASRKAADEKVLQQRQIKGLDQAERKVTEASKKVQSAPIELEQLADQFTQLYGAAIRPGEGGPRVPGAPALPGGVRPAPAGAGPAKPAAAEMPAAAAEALKKLQAAKAGRGSGRAAARTPEEPKKKLPRARPAPTPATGEDAQQKAAKLREKLAQKDKAASKTPPRKASDLADKVARMKEKAAAASSDSSIASSASAALEKPPKDAHTPQGGDAGQTSEKPPADDQPESDRGALMKKKAEEIKRKMAEAAASGQDETAGPDKTVVMPKRPVSKDGDTTD